VRSFPPHPNPLPWGEGTAMVRFLEFSVADELSPAHSPRMRRKVLPLPKGEGRVRGKGVN